MNCSVVALTNEDPLFYLWVGPWLANREVHRDLGGPPWDDPGKSWWVATVDGHPAGMAAARRQNDTTTRFCSAWVTPDMRQQGIYRAMFTARLAATAGRIVATCTPESLPMHLAHGFVVTRERGRFTEVERDET